MEQFTSCLGREIADEARRWVGYLEHQDGKFIGLPRVNVGKGGYTAFGEIVRSRGGRNLQGLPWCAVFVYAVLLNVLGKKDTRKLIGWPHATAIGLAKAIKRRGLWCDYMKDLSVGDIVFLSNDGERIDHCGIVVETDGHNSFTTIEGNAIDDSGHFERALGGSVAIRKREQCCDSSFMGGGAITRRLKDGNL